MPEPNAMEEAMRYAVPALLLALAAAPAAAQDPAPERPTNPAARLLANRQELALTSEQVRRLEEIDRRVTQQQGELRTRLEALRGRAMGEPLRMRDMTAEQRQQLQARRGEMEPLMAQLRALHAQAIADSRGVLTVEQSDRAGRLFFGGPGQGRGPGAGMRGGPSGPAGWGRGPAAWRAGRGFGPRAGWQAGPGFRGPWWMGRGGAGPGFGWRWREEPGS
jgi:hypothetical protein